MTKNYILALAGIIGTIIGAGVFAVPYLMAQAGILLCVFYFIILGAVAMILHLFFAEIVLKTKENLRLIGHTEKYLGKNAKAVVGISCILGLTGALLAYIILAGSFLSIIFSSVFSGFWWSIIVWAFLSFLILLGIESIAKTELFMSLGLLLVAGAIFIIGIPKIDFSNFILFNKANIFLPFGVVFFSLIGWSAVPETAVILKNKHLLKKAIVIALLVAIVFYILFGLTISGIAGSQTKPDAFSGLEQFFGRKIIMLGALFGLLAVSTSFLVLGNYFKNTIILDFKLPRQISFLLATLAPLVLFLLGFNQFITVISFVGILVGLVEGTAIILIYKKIKQQQLSKSFHFLLYSLIVILILGALSQVIYHL